MCARAGDSEAITDGLAAPGSPVENRRSFLAALLGVGSVFVGGLLAVPLIRFALFPLLRRTTELKSSPVGAVSEFSSLSEPVMRTIQIEQVDGWRRAVSEKALYVTKDQHGQLRVLTSVCPHLGCTVPWNKEKNQFVCPCHGATFSPDGTRVSGPSQRGMDTLETSVQDFEGDELSLLVVRGCLIARDSVFNVRDFLADGSRLAFLAIKDCEKELDQIERKIDEQLPEAITRVGEAKARELLACLKFITDLERIGDLSYSAVMQLQARREKLPTADSRQLVEMASLLYEMLEQIHQGFIERDVLHAQRVLQSDPEVDRLCHSLFQRHLAEPNIPSGQRNFDILLAAQALERIGDHAKNLAEELYSLSEGRSLRHNARKLSTA
jgi:menaquinol-cytochrome c reductase iron-sulfur subunit